MVEAIVDDPGSFRRLPQKERDAVIYRFWAVGRLNIEPWLESRVVKETVTLWPKTRIAAVDEIHDVLSVRLDYKLEELLDEYLQATGLSAEPGSLLFPGALQNNGKLPRQPLRRTDAADMLKRRLKSRFTGSLFPHSFRATGITNFLENDGTVEAAQRIAGHADSRTTKLYDRRRPSIHSSQTGGKPRWALSVRNRALAQTPYQVLRLTQIRPRRLLATYKRDIPRRPRLR
jgi:hypothetical protein